MTPGLVSVLLPVHNGATYLAAALESVLTQTWTELELIVVDDGSTDDTPTVLAACTDPRLQVHRQPAAGVVAALNRGLALARGPWVARMDADDVMAPERLARQVRFLSEHPEVVACGTAYRLVGEGSGVVRVPLTAGRCRAHLLWGSCIAHPTAMIRRETLTRHGIGYREGHPHAEDFRLFSDLAAVGALANLPYVGLDYRLHRDQVSSLGAAVQRAAATGICADNLTAAGHPVAETRLQDALWPRGAGPAAALRYAVRTAPAMLWWGTRAHGAAGLTEAARVARGRIHRLRGGGY